MEASIPMRHLLPTQQAHQRLTCLQELMPREVSGDSLSPVRPGSSYSAAPGAHALEVQRMHDSGELSMSLGRTRASSPGFRDSTCSRGVKPRAESPYKRDPWMALASPDKPCSPAGSTLSLAPASRPIPFSPVLPGSPMRAAGLAATGSSGTLLSLPGQYKQRDRVGSPSMSMTDSVFTLQDGDSAVLASTSMVQGRVGTAPSRQLSMDHMVCETVSCCALGCVRMTCWRMHSAWWHRG
jgi:hypothetical protein